MAGHYQNTVEDQVTGKPVNGATILVYNDGATISGNSVTSGTLATIYSDDGVTEIDQSGSPITTESNGEFDFYTEETRVVIAVLFNGAGLAVWNDADILGGSVSSDVTALAVRVSVLEAFDATLGTIATQDADDVLITGGSITGVDGIPSEATASEIWTGTETDKYLSPDKLYDSAAPTTLTDAATIAVDMATGINFNVTLGGNRTLGNPTNAKPGQSGRIRVTQDGTGSRTLAYASNWKHVTEAPTIATAAGAVDLFAYFVNATDVIELSYVGTLA